MLEHAIVATSDTRKRLLFLPIAIGAHVLLIAAAVWAGVWNVGVPENPPNQFEVYQVTGTPGIPDAAPKPPPPPPAESGQAQEPVRQTPVETVAPFDVPPEIPVLEPPLSSGGSGAGEPDGEPGGKPGGTPGGVPDGELGGTPGGEGTGSGGGSGPLVVGGDVKAPVTIHSVKPDYPRFARQARIEGTVVMSCVIDRQGRIRSAEIEKSVHPILDEAALAAVRQWRFRPGTLNGRPVDVIFHLTVNFSLGR